ncbi:hypothetical protein JHK84_051320 [Glycine max]|nr:hypothetical protein JHK87_051164 [Glycine soja]KAG4937236.1 hypothetical protein JHK85_052155 [Glycine max]KAG5095732.1 hypothetical protein JHK84_051320 [Glycine max]
MVSGGSRDAGHSANEPAITAELVATNEKLKNITKNKGECTEVSGQANRNSYLQIGTANDNMSNVVDCVWRLIHEEEGRKLRKK